MIKFSLVCDAGHTFESWFDSGAGYEAQARRKLIACPECNSPNVSKAIMSPAVHGTQSGRMSVASSDAESKVPVALLDERQQKLRVLARQLRSEIEKNSADVGAEFPKLARAIHDGEAPERSIRGQASIEEARALLDDGIAILPVPTLPDEFN